MLNLVNWRSVNAIYCTLCWLVAIGLALFILARTVPDTRCAKHCAACAQHCGARQGNMVR
jgi:hypothetical protein